MAGAPLGNTNSSKKRRLLGDCLKRELTQNPEDVLAIARRVIQGAKAGEPWAVALAYDRTDGKLPQPIVGDDDEPPVSVKGVLELVRPTDD